MRHITYTCDKCREKITDIRKLHMFGMEESGVDYEDSTYDRVNDADLCEACAAELNGIIKKYLDGEPQEDTGG